jgi:hypothetical protein
MLWKVNKSDNSVCFNQLVHYHFGFQIKESLAWLIFRKSSCLIERKIIVLCLTPDSFTRQGERAATQ